MGHMRQTLLKRLTESHNDAPGEAVRPFDADAAGTVIAEGGGLFILEEYEHAKRRGARIYAEVVGFAASQDTHAITDPEPSGHSYGRAVSKALAEAKVAPDEIGCLVPHGLGIPAHDRAELAGLRAALGAALEDVPLAPTKAQIGNLAAGCGVDAAAAVLALYGGTIPPARNTRRILDGQTLNVAPEPRNAEIRTALSSVYSLGGQNAALVFRKPL